MATEIVMPQLGESVVDGTVSEWLKQVGDTIEEFEPILRVSTDKVDTEIPAPAEGVLLAVYVQEGETVDSGVLLGLIGAPNEAPEPVAVATSNGNHPQAQPQAAQAPAHTQNERKTRPHVTPVVARMVEEHNIDLRQLTGTGRNGRIRKKDVLAYLEKRTQSGAATAQAAELAPWEIPADGELFKPSVDYGTPEDTAQPQPVKSAPAPMPQKPAAPSANMGDIPGELVKLSGMRRSIAQHMVHSKLQAAPHVTTVMEADMSAVVAHRNAHKEQFEKQGVKLTFTPYFVAACARALLDVPEVNARWTDDGLFLNHVANIGLAVALDEGLIVPVIKNAQDYNLVGLARQVNDLAGRARSKQLQPDEVRDGTFTITNHGTSGSLVATPIINQPQSAILGVGMIEDRVKAIDGAIAIRPCTYLSLTFDHRVADGATADGFLMRVKQTLENWS